MSNVTWGQLYDYLLKKCNFQDVDGQVTWTCHGDLRFSEQFCKENNVNWEATKEILEGHGGFCDCEVLFNVEELIGRDMRMVTFDLATGEPY